MNITRPHHAVIIASMLLMAAAAQEAAAACSVTSPGMAFGIYQPLTFAGKLTSSPVTSNTSISIACSGIVTGGSYTIALGPSSAGAGDRISTRYMPNASGGDPMAYNIYREASYLTIWGDGNAGELINGNIPAGDSNQSHTVYGRIPAGQNTLKAGSFSDAMVITLTYNP